MPIEGTIMPIMGTNQEPVTIAAALFGRTRRAVLGLLFTRADERFHMRAIMRLTGAGEGGVQRELASLAGAGLLTRRREGRQVYFQANRDCPVFEEIRSLVVKTSGVADILRGGLVPLVASIDFAFLYGSFARGEEHSGSDVDVLVIGSVGFGDVIASLRAAREQLGREVNATVFSPEEFARGARQEDPFIIDVVEKPKIMLIGDEDGLRELGA